MKLKDFLSITERFAKEWWDSLPESERYPLHKTRWHDFTDEMKYNVYGLYIDHLRGHNYLSTMGELSK